MDTEQDLWRAVLLQAFADACAIACNPVPDRHEWEMSRSAKLTKRGVKDTRAKREKAWQQRRINVRKQYRDVAKVRDEARQWFMLGGDDFEEVCRMAGYEPEFIAEKAAEVRGKNWQMPELVAA